MKKLLDIDQLFAARAIYYILFRNLMEMGAEIGLKITDEIKKDENGNQYHEWKMWNFPLNGSIIREDNAAMVVSENYIDYHTIIMQIGTLLPDIIGSYRAAKERKQAEKAANTDSVTV